MKILFICHGNICRSPMAEFVMKELVKKSGRTDIYIESAATSTEEIGNDIPGTKRKLREEGIPFERRAARRMTAADYSRFDLIVGMDTENIRNILRITGGDPENKVRRLLEFTDRVRDIADPWYTGDFDETFRDIDRGCRGILEDRIEKSEGR